MSDRQKQTGVIHPSILVATKTKAAALDPNAVVIRVQSVFTTPSSTGNDGKDGDTALTVKLVDGTGTVFAIADHWYGEMNNPSTTAIELNIVVQRTRGQLTQGVNTQIHIDPNGHDTWDFDDQVVVTFSDGIQVFANFPGHWLSQDNRDNTYTIGSLAG